MSQREPVTWIDVVDVFQVGDPPPDDYANWHEWARVQGRGGLRQARCPVCQRWRFPQEFPCCKGEEVERV